MAAELIVSALYVVTGLLVGFGFGISWERHRWEDRETFRKEAEAHASLNRMERALGVSGGQHQTFLPPDADGGPRG